MAQQEVLRSMLIFDLEDLGHVQGRECPRRLDGVRNWLGYEVRSTWILTVILPNVVFGSEELNIGVQIWIMVFADNDWAVLCLIERTADIFERLTRRRRSPNGALRGELNPDRLNLSRVNHFQLKEEMSAVCIGRR